MARKVPSPAIAPARKRAASAKTARAAPHAAGGVLSVRRSMLLLELLAEGENPWSLADIARQLEVNKAIAIRLIDELRNCGYVHRDEKTGLYMLTYKLSNLGLRKMDQTRLLDQSGGILRELANESGELVRLGVVEFGPKLTWVLAYVGARRSLHIDPNYRLDIQLNTHAAGKAWLSALSREQAWEILTANGIVKCTVHSKTKRSEIEADLESARVHGFAETYEENELGVVAIAAPIMVRLTAGQTTCMGVVSIAAPTSRVTAADLRAMAPLLLRGVKRLGDIWPIGASNF